MAVNSFGLGGANGHLVIKPYTKIQNIERKNSSKAYRLVQVSGRTETVVEKLLNKIEENREQTGFLALIDNIFSTEIKNHNYRGYAVLNGTARCASKCSLKNRPVWFTYSGMGSQWSEMGKDLIHIDVFRNTLKKCAHTIKQYGLDLEDIVLNGTTATFTDPINCFTSIVAVSVALTDVLFSFGIHPAGIIGHSLGEIGK
ncbi:hypothetical protein NQ314_019141 [Rhamnusium bicolor]|uniref:Uncharacterized protein n=1 Tax=Rhamnusium bicolor TaxID=1586634 RepID=A0AAV8WPC1_9CUCU|nr:hypothetical protein NQ314_019141 [Rhamnusium bicolor]